MGSDDRKGLASLHGAPFARTDLDSHPERAYEAFYRYAVAQLRLYPPAPLRAVHEEDRLDMIHDVVIHCCRDDFRVLRSFDGSRSFSTWFNFVARNHVIDVLRRGRTDLGHLGHRSDESTLLQLPENSPDPERFATHRDLVQLVREALDDLSERCQVLLLGSAEGRSPRELLELLQWPKHLNKKASDDLRACRKRLIRQLEARGLQVSDFVQGG